MSELAVAMFAASTDSHLLAEPRTARFERFRRELDEPTVLADLGRQGIRWIARCDRAFPTRLRKIHDPPPGLFVRGSADLALLDAPCVAVVGARACSAYGATVAAELARGLARAGVVVVSGLARGIDGAAHRGALETGTTVAVLGCGVDRDYPRAHRMLAAAIAERGLIVSEYPPGVEPAPWRFPASKDSTSSRSSPGARDTKREAVMVLDGYVRVSREGDRKGTEGYHSPKEQEDAIRAKINSLGAELGELITETDVSGGKAARERRLESLVSRCQSGESQGIVVLDFSRFSREHPFEVAETLNRLRKAGTRLISCIDGFDSAGQHGGLIAGVLSDQAHGYREAVKARWEATTKYAVERGVHASRTPFGYARDESKKLVPDPATGPIVLELFERRAAGAAISELERFLADAGHKKARSSTRSMLANETYLGHVKVGQHEHRNAHTPLIGIELWNRVQATKGKRPVHSGALASRVMLRSLLKCGTCGSAMCANWRDGKRLQNGQRERVPVYYCNNRVTCPKGQRATIDAAQLDAYVDEWVMADLAKRDSMADAFQNEERLSEVAAEFAQAEASYDRLIKNVDLLDAYGDDAPEVVANAKGKVELLRIQHGQALKEAQTIDGFNGSMLETWPTLSREAKRSILIDWLDYIRVDALNGRRNVPVAERAAIVIDGALATELTASSVAA